MSIACENVKEKRGNRFKIPIQVSVGKYKKDLRDGMCDAMLGTNS